jgi:group II intron reverse transcriptase/maturase
MGKLIAKLTRALQAQLAQTTPGQHALVPVPPAQPTRSSRVPESNDLFALENLVRAWCKVRANGGGAGVDGQTLADFGAHERANLKTLRDELVSGNYTPPPVRVVYVPKARGDWRPLGILTVRDRVAQRAVYDAIAPVYEKKFLACSFGFREGRSIRDVVATVEQYRDAGRHWVVDGDIKDCFERIDHRLLMKMVARDLSDARIVNLIERWLTARVFNEMRSQKKSIGTYQGGVISPLLANVYLHTFDFELTRAGLALVRYADDWIILNAKKSDAETALDKATRALEKLKLLVNPSKTRITHFDEGFAFLGVFFVGNKHYAVSAGARQVKEAG